MASSQCVLLLLEVPALLLDQEDATLTQPMQAIGRGLGQGTPLALVLCDEASVDSGVGQVCLSQVHSLIDEIADEEQEEEQAAAAAAAGPEQKGAYLLTHTHTSILACELTCPALSVPSTSQRRAGPSGRRGASRGLCGDCCGCCSPGTAISWGEGRGQVRATAAACRCGRWAACCCAVSRRSYTSPPLLLLLLRFSRLLPCCPLGWDRSGLTSLVCLCVCRRARSVPVHQC